jgi:hypothetical protein
MSTGKSIAFQNLRDNVISVSASGLALMKARRLPQLGLFRRSRPRPVCVSGSCGRGAGRIAPTSGLRAPSHAARISHLRTAAAGPGSAQSRPLGLARHARSRAHLLSFVLPPRRGVEQFVDTSATLLLERGWDVRVPRLPTPRRVCTASDRRPAYVLSSFPGPSTSRCCVSLPPRAPRAPVSTKELSQ